MLPGKDDQGPSLAASEVFDSGDKNATTIRMRMVVHTNVLPGACLGTGVANAAIAACLNGSGIPPIGNALFSECEDVFARNELFENCRLSEVNCLMRSLAAANGREFTICGDRSCRTKQTAIWLNSRWLAGQVTS